jgi:hypothetical protein
MRYGANVLIQEQMYAAPATARRVHTAAAALPHRCRGVRVCVCVQQVPEESVTRMGGGKKSEACMLGFIPACYRDIFLTLPNTTLKIYPSHATSTYRVEG